MLSEGERQLQEDRKLLDQHRIEYQHLAENLRKSVAIANDMTMLYKSAIAPGSPGKTEVSNVFDSALQKT
jgi:hypothetical protein